MAIWRDERRNIAPGHAFSKSKCKALDSRETEMAYPPDSTRTTTTRNPDGTVRTTEVHPRSSGAGRTLAVVALIALALLAIAWALGLFNVETEGQLKAPEVEVTGGEVPDVDVQAADIDVGTKETTVEVPTIEVTKPGEKAE